MTEEPWTWQPIWADRQPPPPEPFRNGPSWYQENGAGNRPGFIPASRYDGGEPVASPSRIRGGYQGRSYEFGNGGRGGRGGSRDSSRGRDDEGRRTRRQRRKLWIRSKGHGVELPRGKREREPSQPRAVGWFHRFSSITARADNNGSERYTPGHSS